MIEKIAQEIHHHWFGFLKAPGHFPKEKMSLWFVQNDEVDRKIRNHYQAVLEQAAKGELEEWKKTPRGYLSLILLLDQFSRHIYRGTPEAYACDGVSLELVEKGVEEQIDMHLYPIERCFFYMPLQHIEDLKVQEKSVKLYSLLIDDLPEELKHTFLEFLKYAKMHYDRIAQFGRFPHRNAILNRPSTPEELEFLESHKNWSF